MTKEKKESWKKQSRDASGRFLSFDGVATGKRIYTQADLDREIAQAFLSGTKQAREIVNVTKPDIETLKRAFLAGTNASKSGIFTPSAQFERWAKTEGLM